MAFQEVSAMKLRYGGYLPTSFPQHCRNRVVVTAFRNFPTAIDYTVDHNYFTVLLTTTTLHYYY
jgi:hypothetical protein